MKKKKDCCVPNIHKDRKKNMTEDYLDAFDHIRSLADLEWNGSITRETYFNRIDDIITKISEKENK